MKKTLTKQYPPATASARRKAARDKVEGFEAHDREWSAWLVSAPGAWRVILKNWSLGIPREALYIGAVRRLHKVLGRILDAYDGRHDL